jgi:hypothetical protein
MKDNFETITNTAKEWNYTLTEANTKESSFKIREKERANMFG